MAQPTLSEFFRQKKTQADEARVDWGERKERWLEGVKQLYAQIDEWIEPLSREGVVTRNQSIRTVSEEGLGKYDVPVLTLSVGDETVRFTPVGALVAGAQGRVDVKGDNGEANLILQRDGWGVVVSRTPTLRVVPLTEQTLRETLQRVMRT
jgi:hypothetical protein